MPTHLLLEGEDIESVLARLREDHGPDAKIVQAELVRTGGFAGFFAKRRYEVTVEVDDELGDFAPAEPAPMTTSAPGPVDRPAFSIPMETTDFVPVRPYVPAPLNVPVAEVPAASAPAATELSGIHALLNAAEGQDQADFGGRPIDISGSSRPGIAGDPVIPAQGWHRPVSTQGEAFSDLLGSLTHTLAEPAPVERPAQLRSFGPPAIWAAAAQDQATDPVGPERAAPQAPQATAAPSSAADSAAIELTRDRLAELGVPERLLEQVRDPEPVLALRDVTAALPDPELPTWRPSATRGGALVVVVGPWRLARSAVRGLVHELGADPSAVLTVATETGGDVAEGCSVRSHGAAIGLVQQARQTHDISILVIDSGATRHSATRTAETIATLEPQSVLVVADATSDLKVSLLALDALDQAGVEVASLALARIDRAVRPAAALEIPVPVSWLDGRRATAGTWIGTLVDALAESAGAERGRVGAHARSDRGSHARVRPC